MRGSSRSAGPGRPRDAGIDAAILAAAQRHLASFGYDGMSVSAVAAEAGTTRQAVYRRFPTKADLATAAIAALATAQQRPASADPYVDLVAELDAFAEGITRPHGLALAGTMLQAPDDDELVELYRLRLVDPRRRRLAAILTRAQQAGFVDHDADIELAVSLATGSWYALGLAGKAPPVDWSARVAELVWRSLGGARRRRPVTRDGA